MFETPGRRALGRLCGVLTVAAIAAAAAPASAAKAGGVLTSEATKRVSPAELERLIGVHLGQRITLVKAERRGHFGLKAIVRLPAHAEGKFCSAAQLTIAFLPDPELAPPGTAAGAIHSSQLPLASRETTAAQVYRGHAAALAGWNGAAKRDPCATIDTGLPFFAADSASQAGEALALFESLILAASDSGQPLRLDCGSVDEQTCRRTIAALRADELEAVADRCPQGRALSEQARCLKFDLRSDRKTDGRCYRSLLIAVPARAGGELTARLESGCIVV